MVPSLVHPPNRCPLPLSESRHPHRRFDRAVGKTSASRAVPLSRDSIERFARSRKMLNSSAISKTTIIAVDVSDVSSHTWSRLFSIAVHATWMTPSSSRAPSLRWLCTTHGVPICSNPSSAFPTLLKHCSCCAPGWIPGNRRSRLSQRSVSFSARSVA